MSNMRNRKSLWQRIRSFFRRKKKEPKIEFPHTDDCESHPADDSIDYFFVGMGMPGMGRSFRSRRTKHKTRGIYPGFPKKEA